MTLTQIIEQYPYYEQIGDTQLCQISEDGRNFLTQLFCSNSRVVYARVRAKEILAGSNVAWREEELIGRVTDGSINGDGKSAARRTCNLTFVTDNIKEINNTTWALQHKFFLEIGIETWFDCNIYQAGDIVWFPQGEFYITNFNSSLSTNSFRISISGQDKMAKLNGTIGGTFSTQMLLSSYEQHNEKGEIEYVEELPLKTIISNLVSTYGEEDESNIIIEDLEEEGANLLEYQGNTPLYLILQSTTQTSESRKAVTLTTYGKQKCYVDGVETTLDQLPKYYLSEDENNQGTPLKFTPTSSTTYYCQKVEYGQMAGYEPIQLKYPGDLIGEIGSNVTAVLDKIKNIFTNYEYYYDIFGRFIFKKMSSYCEVTYPTINNENKLSIKLVDQPEPVWVFENLEMQTSLSSNPSIGELKNDFSVWGKRKTTSGETPVHMRVAIQQKPIAYTPVYKINENNEIELNDTISYTSDEYDWRELIYQMALDESRSKKVKGQDWKQKEWQEQIGQQNQQYYPNGITGCEDFYLDMLTFWRELYDPNTPYEYIATTPDDTKAIEGVELNKETGQKQLYLPYTDIDFNFEEDLVDLTNINNYMQNFTEADSGVQYRVKSIDAIDLPTVFYGNPIYGIQGKDIVNLEEQLEVDKRALYYLQKENQVHTWKRLYETWLWTPGHMQSGIELATHIYYAEANNIDNKVSLIAQGNIAFMNLKEVKLYNSSNPLKSFDRTKLLLYKDDGVEPIPIGLVQIDGTSILAVDSSYQFDMHALTEIQTAIVNQKEIRVYSSNDFTTPITFNKENCSIAFYHWRKNELENTDIEFYYDTYATEDEDPYQLLVDYIIQNNSGLFLQRHSFYFSDVDTKIEQYDENNGAHKNSITTTSNSRVTTLVDVAKNTVTITTEKFQPSLNTLIFDKSQLYTKTADEKFQLFNYNEVLLPAYYRDYTKYSIYEDISKSLIETVPVFDYYGNIIGYDEQPIICYYKYYPYGTPNEKIFWNRKYLQEPYNKLFWLEFIEPAEGQWYSQYNKELIGKRAKAINDVNTTALDYALTPNICIGTADSPLPEVYRKYFIVSRQGKSAKEAIDELLFKHTYVTEMVSTSILPLYFLEPNQIIKIKDKQNTGIDNYYSINSFSLPLNYSATMSLSLTKIFEYEK